MVGDLSGTDVTEVNLDLRRPERRRRRSDRISVTVNGTDGDDADHASQATARDHGRSGCQATVNIRGADATAAIS